MNLIVMGQLSSTMINAIKLTKTDEWPSGKAWLVFKELESRFAPDDDIAEMETEEELLKLRIKKNESPKDIDDSIAAISIKYGCKLSDKEWQKSF